MKVEPTSQPDPALHGLLREWKVTETLPPRFEERVWQRLARNESGQPTSIGALVIGRWLAALTRPSTALAYVTALLLLGLVGGYWEAHQQNEQAEASLGARYVQMLDPYQMPHHP